MMTKEQLLEYIDVYIRQQGDYGAVRIAPVLEALVKNMGEGGVIPSGPTSGRPENPVVGTQYFDTDLGQTVTWNGTEWVEPAAGQETVLLHADTGSATEDNGTTTYRFTETQEEIDKIIDAANGAEVINAVMAFNLEQMLFSGVSLVKVVSGGFEGYAGVAMLPDVVNGKSSMMTAIISKTSEASKVATLSQDDIKDYLVPNNFYTRTMRSGAYINTDGEYVENENFNVIDIYASGGGMSTPQYGTVVITNNDTDEATGISVFSGSSLKPVDYESPSRTTQVCFNSPFAYYASIHKNAKVFTYKSSVFAFMMRQVHKLQEMWNFFGIDIDSSIDIQSVSMYSEGAIADKYNNIHGEQVDKEADEGIGKDYFIFPLTLKAGDILTFDSRPGTTTDMAALKDANGNIIPAVPLNADGSPQALVYMASKDINVELSGCSYLNYQKSNSFVFKFILQAINKTRDFMGINGRMQQLTPEAAQEGKYNRTNGEIGESEFYKITAPISLKEGETLLVKTISTADVCIIKDADGNMVVGRQEMQSTPVFYSYTATKDTTVEVSCGLISYIYKFNSAVFEQLAKQIAENKGDDDGNLLFELPYLTGNFSTPTLGSGITDMPTLVAKIKAAKSVTLRNPSGASVACIYWNAHSDGTAVRLITVADTLNQENVLRSNVQITYTDSSSNFFVNIVPETVTNTLVLKFPTFNGVWNVATLADGIDDMAALLDRLASHPVVLLQSGDNEFRQCVRYVLNAAEQRVYFYTVGNKINGRGMNIYTVFNVTYDTGTAQFHAEYTDYPDENGGNVEIVTELPETPDENTVYIIKGS